MSPFEKLQSEKILACYDNRLSKGYVMGSRGGHIIGKTRSGKPIYEIADHPGHQNFTPKEHLEAVKLHQVLKDDDAEHRQEFHNKQISDHIDLAENSNLEVA